MNSVIARSVATKQSPAPFVIARSDSDEAISRALPIQEDCFASAKAFAPLTGWAPLAMTTGTIAMTRELVG